MISFITSIFQLSQFKKKDRAHPELNRGPIGLQPIALPLSYRPDVTFTPDSSTELTIVVAYLHNPLPISEQFFWPFSRTLSSSIPFFCKLLT